jgi:hypothetical protein
MSKTAALNDVLNHLETFPEELSKQLLDLDKYTLVEKPDGKWSIQQNAGHLLAIESLWIARLDDFMLNHETLRPWNGTNEETDQAQFNLQYLPQILADFEAIRSAHCRMIRLSLDKLHSSVCVHPRTGEAVTFEEHLQCMQKHDQAHLRAIGERLQ